MLFHLRLIYAKWKTIPHVTEIYIFQTNVTTFLHLRDVKFRRKKIILAKSFPIESSDFEYLWRHAICWHENCH